MSISEIVDLTKAYYCLDCGICTGSCPVSRVTEDFSPRLMVERVLMDQEESPYEDVNIWSCLSCGQCTSRCPSKIDYPEFVRRVRAEAFAVHKGGVAAHRGLFQSIMRLQTLDVKQNRTEWAKEAGKIAEKGDTYYFVGCSPFFQVEFENDWNVDVMEGPRGVLKLLNAAGVEPVISDEERCCGHDLMWNGDVENFTKLARRNVELIRDLGCKRVVFQCPEGYITFKKYYPEVLGKELDLELVHFYELLADSLKEGAFKLEPSEGVITYHDPCRLARQAGIVESPRTLIQSIPGIEFKEMEHNRENAICCGTSAWMNCSSCSKEIQKTRIGEAVAAGADTMVTACPKCRLHLSCALKDMEIDFKIRDMNELLAQSLAG